MQTETSPKAGERTQHTPGPWRTSECREPDDFGHAMEIEVEGETLAHVYPSEDMEANARLIAAAPKMAALIRRIYDHEGTTIQLESSIVREMQDCITEAGLIK